MGRARGALGMSSLLDSGAPCLSHSSPPQTGLSGVWIAVPTTGSASLAQSGLLWCSGHIWVGVHVRVRVEDGQWRLDGWPLDGARGGLGVCVDGWVNP